MHFITVTENLETWRIGPSTGPSESISGTYCFKSKIKIFALVCRIQVASAQPCQPAPESRGVRFYDVTGPETKTILVVLSTSSTALFHLQI